MSKSVLAVLGLSVFLTGCFGLFGDDSAPVAPVVVEPTEVELDRPQFDVEIDEDDAFDKALDAIPADAVPRFEEVIDEIDPDAIQAADEGEKQELENEEDKAARAASEARGIARAQNQTGTDNRGLDIRQYSDDLYAQVKGVRTFLLYFRSADCTECDEWESSIRAEADAFAERNTLIVLADIDEQVELAAEMKVTAPGNAMMITGLGEIMGPMPSSVIDKERLLFIFQ